MNESDHLSEIRHSCAHLLAAAVLKLFPGTKRAIGPAIETGFYYDFNFAQPVTEDDFRKIEKEMHRILKTWTKFEKKEISTKEALSLFKDEPYKIELIHDFTHDNQKLTIYQSGDYTDLCKGGHAQNPQKEIGAFKLLSIAGAYWKGDEKNKMLTRIYGTAFPTKKVLDEYLIRLEEAKRRDHKKLGKDLDLFTFSDTVGKGLPLWTPKGSTIRRILERFIVDEELKRGYLHVYTPDIASLDLYKKSGHYPYYKETMYAPITIEDEEYMLRPMTCPHHFELYNSRPHSYKELPIGYAELAKLYRFEKSGELSGLLRVRSFTLADAHIICRIDQAKDEINKVLDLIEYITGALGLIANVNYSYRLSLGDRKDTKKFYKNDSAWDYAENTLREVLATRKSNFVEAPAEAAFYGPKIDIQMKNFSGKEETAFTIQYDFVMPERFKLTYINSEGAEEQPIVIHRSSIGAIERTVAFLIEHYAGAFPLWLAPLQIALLPITDRHIPYAQKVNEMLHKEGIRSEVDMRPERLQAKIRNATLQKVPFMGIIGDKEIAEEAIGLRARTGEDLGQIKLNQFLRNLKEDIDKKR